MSITNVPERLASKKDAAAHVHVSEGTIKNWLRSGAITGYRINRYVVVDLDEVEREARRRRSRQPYGPNARIVDISRQRSEVAR